MGLFLKKVWGDITYFHNEPFPVLSLCECLVCVCVCVYVCVSYVIYTNSISFICVSKEEPSLITSNQQIYSFYKWIIFQKKRK